MSMIRKAVLPVLALAATLGAASSPSAPLHQESFLPPNDMRIEVSAAWFRGITQWQYDRVLDRIEAVYAPIVAAKGGRLVVNRLWTNATVNASAQQFPDGTWALNMYGGLARHRAITMDGFALVACHELGHHLGGAPRYDGGLDWAANEGQSDYFAVSKCLHRILGDSITERFSRPRRLPEAIAPCAAAYESRRDREVCERSVSAGMSVTALFRALRQETREPELDTPDAAVVTEMLDRHPGTQCRLDTYYQGSICTQPWTRDFSASDTVTGACTASQGYDVGIRPRCWYLPTEDELVPPALPAAADPLVALERQEAARAAVLTALPSGEAFTGL